MQLNLSSPTHISLLLCLFFLTAAAIKAIGNSRYRRKMRRKKAAEEMGGTEEAPIRLFNPFSDAQDAPGGEKPQKPAPPEPQKPKESPYKWL